MNLLQDAGVEGYQMREQQLPLPGVTNVIQKTLPPDYRSLMEFQFSTVLLKSALDNFGIGMSEAIDAHITKLCSDVVKTHRALVRKNGVEEKS